MKTLTCNLLLIAFLFSIGEKMFGQDRVNFSLGIRALEQLNVGIKYQILDQAKIGLNLGWWPENDVNGWLLSIQGN